MTGRKSFGSDNHAGMHPAVLHEIMDANSGDAVAYGADERTGQVTALLREAFRADGGWQADPRADRRAAYRAR